MLSRVADSIYWMGRYVERAENVARFIDVNLNLALDGSAGFDRQWLPLVNTTGDDQEFGKRFASPTQQNVIQFLTFDPDNSNSIYSCLRSARENARSIRDIITSSMWEELNTFYLRVKEASQDPATLESPGNFYSEVRRAANLFSGLTDATMTRNEAWHFLEMARMLERADKTSRILDVKYYLLLRSAADVGTPFDDIQWAAVLRSASAYEMYRKRHGRILPADIIEFLLLSNEFPRSVRFCVEAARHSLHAITGTPLGSFRNVSEKLLGQLCSDLAFTNTTEIVTWGLHEYVDELQSKMNQVDNGIFDTFFAFKTPKASRRFAREENQ